MSGPLLGIGSPADDWKRVVDSFDRYLKKPTKEIQIAAARESCRYQRQTIELEKVDHVGKHTRTDRDPAD